jgi:hypothetical protein
MSFFSYTTLIRFDSIGPQLSRQMLQTGIGKVPFQGSFGATRLTWVQRSIESGGFTCFSKNIALTQP